MYLKIFGYLLKEKKKSLNDTTFPLDEKDEKSTLAKRVDFFSG